MMIVACKKRKSRGNSMLETVYRVIMKTCYSCKIAQPTSNFGIDNKQTDKLNITCKSCRKLYREQNREKIKAQRLQALPRTRVTKAKYDIKYRESNKDKIREYKKKWSEKNKDNILMRIKRNLRRRIHHVIKDNYKSDHTITLLGCDIAFFKNHLESQFKPGMNWDNYGLGADKWHIDHIRPCCDFDLSNPEEQRKCFHYSNMQPLWEAENLRKSYIYEGKNCRTTIKQ